MIERDIQFIQTVPSPGLGAFLKVFVPPLLANSELTNIGLTSYFNLVVSLPTP